MVVTRGDIVMRPEVRDPAVLDDQQAIGVEARRFTLPSDMPPRIVDEVEERSPDAECGHWPPSHRAPHGSSGAAIVPATSKGRATLSLPTRPRARVEFRRSLRDVPC
jgi:hypothetical protein